jgi:hypothetical protein
VADGVDAEVHSVQAACAHAVGDRAVREPQRAELPSRDDPVLSGGQLGEGMVALELDEFWL